MDLYPLKILIMWASCVQIRSKKEVNKVTNWLSCRVMLRWPNITKPCLCNCDVQIKTKDVQFSNKIIVKGE